MRTRPRQRRLVLELAEARCLMTVTFVEAAVAHSSAAFELIDINEIGAHINSVIDTGGQSQMLQVVSPRYDAASSPGGFFGGQYTPEVVDYLWLHTNADTSQHPGISYEMRPADNTNWDFHSLTPAYANSFSAQLHTDHYEFLPSAWDAVDAASVFPLSSGSPALLPSSAVFTRLMQDESVAIPSVVQPSSIVPSVLFQTTPDVVADTHSTHIAEMGTIDGPLPASVDVSGTEMIRPAPIVITPEQKPPSIGNGLQSQATQPFSGDRATVHAASTFATERNQDATWLLQTHGPDIDSFSKSYPTSPKEISSHEETQLRADNLQSSSWSMDSLEHPTAVSPLRSLVSLYENGPAPLEQLVPPSRSAMDTSLNQLATTPGVPQTTAPESPATRAIMRPSDPAISLVEPIARSAESIAFESVSSFLDAAEQTTAAIVPEFDVDLPLHRASIEFQTEPTDLGASSREARITPLNDDFIDIGSVEAMHSVTSHTGAATMHVYAVESRPHPGLALEVGSYGSTRRLESIDVGPQETVKQPRQTSQEPTFDAAAQSAPIGIELQVFGSTTPLLRPDAVTYLVATAAESSHWKPTATVATGESVAIELVGPSEFQVESIQTAGTLQDDPSFSRSTSWGSVIMVLVGATYFRSRFLTESLDRSSKLSPNECPDHAIR